MLAICALAILAQTSSKFNEIVYPLDQRTIDAALLNSLDLVAIVEPISSVVDEKRELIGSAAGHNAHGYVNTDTFRIVDSPDRTAGSQVVAVRFHGDSYRGDYENPSLQRYPRYLLFAKRSKSRRLVPWGQQTFRVGNAPAVPVMRNSNEVMGVSLIPTAQNKVHVVKDRWKTCIRSLVGAFEGADDEAARRIAKMLFQFEPKDVLGDDPTTTAAIRSQLPKLEAYPRVMAKCILTIWKHASFDDFLGELRRADGAGARLDVEHDRFLYWNAMSGDRSTPTASLLEIVLEAKTSRLRWFCLQNVRSNEVPHTQVMASLLELADDPDPEVRILMFQHLSRWLKTRTYAPIQGYDEHSKLIVKNQEELVRFYRNKLGLDNPPPDRR